MVVRFFFILLLSIRYITAIAQTNDDNRQFGLLIGATGKPGGIYIYYFNALTGKFTYGSKLEGKEAVNPSYMVVSNDEKHVYSVCKGENGNDRISAFALNTGRLTLLNTVSCGGSTPAYVDVDKGNKYVFVGNFGSGTLAAIPINKDGSLNDEIQVISNKGSSIDTIRQDKPHVHCTILSPDNRFLFVTDLGTDKVQSYKLDLQKNSHPINLQDTSFINAKPGTGPRHLTFHPDGKYAYLIHEMGGLITAYNYRNGKLKESQTVSIMPENFTGEVRAADIHVSPDGRFLYGSNRGDADEIVIYKIDKKGKLSFQGRQATLGKGPRNFAIDPTGNFLLVANQNTNNIFVFKRNKETGLLTPTGESIVAEGPACLKFFSVAQQSSSDSLFTLSDNNISVTINAKASSRMISLKLNCNELLAPQQTKENYGSELRLSPQGKWRSTEQLKHLQYNVASISKTSLLLESAADTINGFRYSSKYELNKIDSSLEVTYTITNISNKIQEVAPWEVTCVPTGGVAFFPKGLTNDIPRSNTQRPLLSVRDSGGVIWYPYDTSQVSAQKLAMKGSEGWLGYANKDVLFVKQIPVIHYSQLAPGQANIELYVNKEKSFIELENQGVYSRLSKGEALTYTVKWYVRALPRNIKIEAGNKSLIEYARRIAH